MGKVSDCEIMVAVRSEGSRMESREQRYACNSGVLLPKRNADYFQYIVRKEAGLYLAPGPSNDEITTRNSIQHVCVRPSHYHLSRCPTVEPQEVLVRGYAQPSHVDRERSHHDFPDPDSSLTIHSKEPSRSETIYAAHDRLSLE